MEKNRKTKIIAIIALVISIFGVTIGFAAFSNVLTISSSASVTPDASTFSVKFSTKQDELDESNVTASNITSGITSTSGVIDNISSPTLTNLSTAFTAPGQYVEYTVYARNEGEYKAYLNNINFVGTKTCTGSLDATESLVNAACSSINLTVTVGGVEYDKTTSLTGHILEKGAGEEVKVKLSYDSTGARVDGEFVVTFQDITLVYSTIDDAAFVPLTTGVAENTRTINYIMKSEATTDAEVDFNDTPVAGIYQKNETSTDTNPVYYYRGAVDNNNVLFANFCWKIVRTTSTGGVKLIYNGTPTEGACNGTNPTIGTSAFNTNYTSKEDVRYIYSDGTGSTIKTAIDNWYSANLLSYTHMLEDTPWCSDLSEVPASEVGVTDTVEGTVAYGAYKRSIDGTPSVDCASDYELTVATTEVGKHLKYPIALLTADEIVMAGARLYGTDAYDVNSYLNIGTIYRALSPAIFYPGTASVVAVVCSDGALYGDFANFIYGVRPAVSLKPGAKLTGSGTGTASKPYIISY